jgi:hypothetical protein
MSLGLGEIVKRFGHSRPTAHTIDALESNRHLAIELALHWDETLPEGTSKDKAIDALELALVYANKAVARAGSSQPPLPDDLPPGASVG